ncbi:MAG: ABC transporter permease [Chloroflexi bacterium]|nr:ABC transporter permease [Chloroflexota bacterium]
MSVREPRTRRERTSVSVLTGPTVIWLLLFFIVPLGVIFVYSFLQRGAFGGVEWVFQIDNYLRFADALYINIFVRSLWIAVLTTLICLLIGYPVAFWMSRRPAWMQGGLLLLIMVPFWTNFVVRMYAWRLLLFRQGILNGFVMGLGLREEPLALLFTPTAVVIGLVFAWVVNMILPCYASLVGLNDAMLEAAQDLYANRWQTFWKVVVPLTMPGIVSGSILVFVPSLGAYVIPDMLGGGSADMIGNLIHQQFTSGQNWPFGSAISVLLMLTMLIGTLIYFRVARQRTAQGIVG